MIFGGIVRYVIITYEIESIHFIDLWNFSKNMAEILSDYELYIHDDEWGPDIPFKHHQKYMLCYMAIKNWK